MATSQHVRVVKHASSIPHRFGVPGSPAIPTFLTSYAQKQAPPYRHAHQCKLTGILHYGEAATCSDVFWGVAKRSIQRNPIPVNCHRGVAHSSWSFRVQPLLKTKNRIPYLCFAGKRSDPAFTVQECVS